MMHNTPATGQSDGSPHPGIPEIIGITRLQVFLFFLINVHSSSICAWVRCKPVMQWRLTTAAC
jgi:hypothetical protein